MSRTFAVIGAGNIGTALALVLAAHRRPVNIYCIEPEVFEDINSKGENTKYLKGIALPRNIKAVAGLPEALAGAEAVFMAIPSFALGEVMQGVTPLLGKNTAVGCITKGLDETTLAPVSLTARAKLPPGLRKNFCLLGGPAIANEIAHGKPSAMVVAGENPAALDVLSGSLQGEVLKIGQSRDIVGVGYAMALKNSYAIALGLCQGLKYPMNTQALVMTLALNEMATILKAVGAKPETAFSLAGLGDLLVTGLSAHSRNRTYGELLVGARVNEPKQLGLTTVEGIATVSIALRLAAKKKIRVPLLETVEACIKSRLHFERPLIKFLKQLTLE
ncbi:MAG: NAD(P)H-dependent glycerol-3-phosphate dehydrogenase [Patescibacteria group bacterium]